MKHWRKPLDTAHIKTPRSRVRILRERCKGCGFCVEYCPYNVLEISNEFNNMGYHPPHVKNAEACTNCGLCEMLCPEFAIYLEEQEEVPES